MDNAGGVGFRQPFGGVLQEPEQLSQLSSLLMNLLAQSSAIDELHGDEVHTVALADFMDGSDVRMIERRRGLRFLFEAPYSILIRREVSRKNLQRDLAVQARVLGQIDFAHSPRTNVRDDFVMRDGLVDEAHFFNCAVQFSTTLIGGAGALSVTTLTRKRCPSLLGAYWVPSISKSCCG